MTQERLTPERHLENSETEFAERYAAFAASGTLYPQLEGSPLLEFSSAGRVLYLFDRTGPYTAKPGPARLIVHGLLDLAETAGLPTDQEQAEKLSVVGISGVEGVGRVLQVFPRTWVVQARLPLVLSAYSPLPDVLLGDWVSFRTLPPLHGFLAPE